MLTGTETFCHPLQPKSATSWLQSRAVVSCLFLTELPSTKLDAQCARRYERSLKAPTQFFLTASRSCSCRCSQIMVVDFTFVRAWKYCWEWDGCPAAVPSCSRHGAMQTAMMGQSLMPLQVPLHGEGLGSQSLVKSPSFHRQMLPVF